MKVNEAISKILHNLFFKMFSRYSLSVVAINSILLLINLVRRFAFADHDDSKSQIAYVVLCRGLAIISFLAFHLVTLRCHQPSFVMVSNILLPMVVFEFNTLFFSYTDAYLTHALFAIPFREINTLILNSKQIFICEAVSILYHMARAALLKMIDPTYPVFAFVTYMTSYICINIPIIENYITLQNVIIDYDSLRNDFQAIILHLPIPMFRFMLHPAQVTLTNEEFISLLAQMKICTADEFISKLIQNTTILSLVEDEATTGHLNFSHESVEYSITIKKMKEQSNCYIGCIQNLSIYKEIESLKAKELYKKMYMSAINHHLRTPLNGIYFPLTVIKENYSTQAFDDYLESALSSLEILISLVDDTIAFSDMECHKLIINKEHTYIPSIIKKISEMFAFESKKKRIPINIENYLEKPYALIDSAKIKQILVILISNALKYTIKGNVSLICQNFQNNLMFTVEDTGVGIKDNEVINIFKEFEQVESVVTEQTTSSKFQLSLVKKLLDLMDGKIEVLSKLNKGTKFVITLNNVLTDTTSCSSLSKDKIMEEKYYPINKLKIFDFPNEKESFLTKTTASSKPYLKVLIVDDNATNIFVLQRMILQIGIKTEIETAVNGVQSIEKVSQRGMGGYSLILMDINMPVMNGLEASRIINSQIQEGKVCKTPIVAITAQNDTNMMEQCEKVGIIKCIFKPVKINELRQLLISISENLV